MDFFVNELSLHGQFKNVSEFRQAIREVMGCRERITRYKRRIFVSRCIVDREVLQGGKTFRKTVPETGNKDFVRLVMIWIDRDGPFIEDNRISDPGEYLSLPGHNDEVVTDAGIGEAAFRQFRGSDTSLVSFAPSNYNYTPIEVCWHHNDSDVKSCDLLNFWEAQKLENHLQTRQSPPSSWQDMIVQLPSRFPNLTFLNNLDKHLVGEPFDVCIVERVFVLLDVLNQLKVSFDNQGERTRNGEELLDNYFRRQNALFSDASDQEKNDPNLRSRMIFSDSDSPQLECFWHGKIRHREYRIHFTYPITSNQPLYIAYIGPKLTKK
ncbi:hypothetical protein [Roseiflexus sp.]